jgi:hypothetical protein
MDYYFQTATEEKSNTELLHRGEILLKENEALQDKFPKTAII